jgi:hypothetical protein
MVYDALDTFSYINVTASVELGLRNPGLTYGLSQTSVLHLSGLFLFPALLRFHQRNGAYSFALSIGVLFVLLSIFLIGRTGIVLGVVLVPVMLLLHVVAAKGSDKRGSLLVVMFIATCCLSLYVVYSSFSHILPERLVQSIQRAEEAVLFFQAIGETPTTQYLAEMYFLPESWHEGLFGTSSLGRGPLAYLESDVGYVKLIFASGLIGVCLAVLPYLLGVRLAVDSINRSLLAPIAIALLLSLLATLMLNFKELALLTRNQWSVQAILFSVIAFELCRDDRSRATLRHGG